MKHRSTYDVPQWGARGKTLFATADMTSSGTLPRTKPSPRVLSIGYWRIETVSSSFFLLIALVLQTQTFGRQLILIIARDPLLREFLRTVSVLDSQTHRLPPKLLAANTLDYPLGHATVVAWKSDPAARILRVSGPSGFGTTTFASQVLGDLLEHQQQSGQKASSNATIATTTILSFAFSKSNPRARTAFSLYLSLCRQLVSFQPQLFRHVSSAASFWMKSSTCLTAECLWILFRAMVTNLVEKGTPVYCIICAVDQCVTSPGETKAIQRLKELVDAGEGRFKLLYTQATAATTTSMPTTTTATTPDDELDTVSTGDEQCLRIAIDKHSQEMQAWKELHIRSIIQDLVWENASWDGLADLAVQQAKQQPIGSPFLLTKINMLLLAWATKGWTRKSLKEKLSKPLGSLQDCYDEAIRTIKDECRNWVLLALKWIAFAVRPLRPSELAVAVAISEISGPTAVVPQDGDGSHLPSDIRDMTRTDIIGELRDCMAPLTQVDNNRVSFIHASLGDYARSSPDLKCSSARSDGPEKAAEDDHDCHILGHCLKYLQHVGRLALSLTPSLISENSGGSSDTSQPLVPTDHEYGLLTYATLHWPDHFLKTTSTKAARKLVLEFLEDDQQVSRWASLYRRLGPMLGGRSASIDSPFRITCRFGLSDLVDEAVSRAKMLAGESEEALQAEKTTGLDLAVEYGHDDLVQTLLEMGIGSSNALGLAAARGSVHTVEKILAIDPEGIDRPSWNRYAPIHHAANAGHKHVVSLLLDRNASADVQTAQPEEEEEAAGRRAAMGVSAPSDADSDSDSGSNPGPASDSDQSTLADLFPASVWSETSLHLAARTGQLDIVKFLLSKNASLHAVSSVDYDALKYAAVGGFVAVASTLLDSGAARDTPSATDGNTALHLAAVYGHANVVQLLMRGAKGENHPVHMANTSGLTPVDLAAREGHLDVLRSVFDVMDGRNAESTSATSTDKEDKQSRRDVPASASRPKSGSPARRLDPVPGIQRRPTDKGPTTRTKSRAKEAEKKPWIPINDNNRKSALEWAAERGHCHVVQALLARSADMAPQKAAQDDHGKTALHMAAKAGHASTIEALLKNGPCSRLFPVSDPESRKGMTPLHLAAQAGHADVVKILLNHQAPPNKQDNRGQTALHHAAIQGHLRCVDQLLSEKSDAKIARQDGKTALHLAAKCGHLAIIRRMAIQDKETLWIEDGRSAGALDYVVDRGVLEEVQEFVQILEDVGGKDFERKGTPLHAAALEHDTSILAFLLDRGWNRGTRRESDGRTPLHEAVSAWSLEGVKLLLADMAKCDVSAVDNQGDSPLHHAGQLGIVHALLGAGAENDGKNNDGETPSYLAVWRGEMDILQALLDSTPKPDLAMTDSQKWSLLHAAYDNSDIARMLLDLHVDPDVQNADGKTPLSLALENGYHSTAQVLIDAGADPNKSAGFYSSPLHGVFFSRHRSDLLTMIKNLVDHGADLLNMSEDGVTVLHLAIRHGMGDIVDYVIDTLNNNEAQDKVRDLYGAALCECVSPAFDLNTAKRLLDQKIDINKVSAHSRLNALQEACAGGTFEAVKWLLDQKADVDAKGGKYGTALCAAIGSPLETREKVLALLEHEPKADVNLSIEKQPTPLQWAVSRGDVSLVDLLLQHGAEPNLTGPGGDTPLNEAISRTDVPLAVIGLLLNHDADIHKRGVDGKLPVHMAAISDRPDAMELLCSAGADARAKDDNGLSPLMYGLVNRSSTIVQALLSRDAYDPEETDCKRQTPVIVATLLGDKTNLRMLLSYGFADPSILDAKDLHGKTALAYAVRMDLLDVVNLLIKKGANPSIVDCRGYGPLYWAVRAASQETTEAVIKALELRESSDKMSSHDVAKHWGMAVHGAVASGKRQALERLLDRYDVDIDMKTPDGWTPFYTARRYESYRIVAILHRKSMQYHQEEHSALQIPSRWHAGDKHPGILIDQENACAFFTDGKLNQTRQRTGNCLRPREVLAPSQDHMPN
jgi:ankyrin repeat protein